MKTSNIIVTTTAIDKTKIFKSRNNTSSKIIRVLFLGKIQNIKGIEELIDAIILLKTKTIK